MDGLSVASGIAGLVGLTLELGNLLGQYCAAVKNASKDIQTLQEEFIALSHVLKQLEKFLVSENVKNRSFNQTSVLCYAVGPRRERSSSLLDKLKEGNGGTIPRAIEKLKWPFREKDIRKELGS